MAKPAEPKVKMYCHRCLCERELEEAVFFVKRAEKWKHVVEIRTPQEQRTAVFCPLHLELDRANDKAHQVLAA